MVEPHVAGLQTTHVLVTIKKDEGLSNETESYGKSSLYRPLRPTIDSNQGRLTF
jgi:hypothetical protein